MKVKVFREERIWVAQKVEKFPRIEGRGTSIEHALMCLRRIIEAFGVFANDFEVIISTSELDPVSPHGNSKRPERTLSLVPSKN